MGRNTYAVLCTTSQGLFAVAPDDIVVGRKLASSGSYGANELDLLLSVVKNTSNVCVVGAHIGAFLVPIGKIAAHVHGIEANPVTFQLLETNVILNELANVTLWNVAAFDKVGKIEFLLNTANSGGSKIVPKKWSLLYAADGPRKVEVDTIVLDEVVGEFIYDLVVMDIEGSEVFALKGMQKILRNTNALFIEFLPHHIRDVAGSSVSEFVSLVRDHFDVLRIVESGEHVQNRDFLPVLQAMFDREMGVNLLFQKDSS